MKILKITFTILAISTLIILTNSNCKKENKETLNTSCDSTNISYVNTVKPILQSNCYNCHSAANAPTQASGIELDDYSDVWNEIDTTNGMGGGRLVKDIEHTRNPMPKSYKLPACDIAKIRNWVKEGAKNN